MFDGNVHSCLAEKNLPVIEFIFSALLKALKPFLLFCFPVLQQGDNSTDSLNSHTIACMRGRLYDAVSPCNSSPQWKYNRTVMRPDVANSLDPFSLSRLVNRYGRD